MREESENKTICRLQIWWIQKQWKWDRFGNCSFAWLAVDCKKTTENKCSTALSKEYERYLLFNVVFVLHIMVCTDPIHPLSNINRFTLPTSIGWHIRLFKYVDLSFGSFLRRLATTLASLLLYGFISHCMVGNPSPRLHHPLRISIMVNGSRCMVLSQAPREWHGGQMSVLPYFFLK